MKQDDDLDNDIRHDVGGGQNPERSGEGTAPPSEWARRTLPPTPPARNPKNNDRREGRLIPARFMRAPRRAFFACLSFSPS